MNRLAQALRNGGGAVPALRSRLLRAARRVREDRSLPATRRVSKRIQPEVLGGDLLQVLGQPLRSLLEAGTSRADERGPSHARADFAAPGRNDRGLPAFANREGTQATRRIFASVAPQGSGPGTSAVDELDAPDSRAISHLASRESRANARRTLSAVIESYWSKAEASAVTAAPTVRAAAQHERPALPRAHEAAEARPSLPAQQVIDRLRAFENARPREFRERTWGPLPRYDAPAPARAVTAGGEPVELAGDLAERVADLLREQALAHGIDVS